MYSYVWVMVALCCLLNPSWPWQGKIKANLLVKVAGCFRSQRNACRDITRLIRRTPGATLKISIDVCKVNVKLRKPIRCASIWWPILALKSWCKYLLDHCPQLLLAGHCLTDNFQPTFVEFWEKYKLVCPDHPIFNSGHDINFGTAIPIYIHGDEGRGLLKRPYMVISWQCVVGHGGLQVCNDSSLLTEKLVPILIPFKRFDQSWFDWPKACMQVMKLFNPNPMFWVMSWPRHTFTTRWLFTGISSHLYYGDWTLDDLLAELTRQAIDAFESGICDPWCVPKKTQCPIWLLNFGGCWVFPCFHVPFPSCLGLWGCQWYPSPPGLHWYQRRLGIVAKSPLDWML